MKIHILKIIWVLRALVYKPFFKKLDMLSYIGKPIFLMGTSKISIGKHVRIFPGIRMEAIGTGKIEVGNNTVIEQNVHIISAGSMLRIGKNVTLAPNVFITNVNHEYSDINKSVMDQGQILKETSIGDGCFIGYGAAIQAGTKLGKHCIIGSNAVVKGTFPDYCVLMGSPAKIVKKYNTLIEKWEKI